jgi:lysophospholipase L1-like esterase
LGLGILAFSEIACRVLPWPAAAAGSISEPARALFSAKRAQDDPFVLVLGDSVMGSSAMESAGIANASERTIPARFEHLLNRAAVDTTVANLAMEGALVGDYLGLLGLLTEHRLRPTAAVIQIDYRLLSPLHDVEDAGNLSRDWLTSYAAPWAGLLAPRGRAVTASERPIDGLISRTILLRSDAYLWLRNLHAQFFAIRTAAVTEQARERYNDLLRMRVGRFYLNEADITASATLLVFAALMDQLRQMAIPTAVFLTPANPEFLRDQMNRAVYAYNVHALGEWFRRRYGSTRLIRLISMEEIFGSADFLDHTHLTPAANAKAAKIMFDELVLLNEARP